MNIYSAVTCMVSRKLRYEQMFATSALSRGVAMPVVGHGWSLRLSVVSIFSVVNSSVIPCYFVGGVIFVDLWRLHTSVISMFLFIGHRHGQPAI